MPFNIGPLQLVLILLILLVVFGARRLPDIGRALGSSAREFKDGITGESKPPSEQSEADSKAEATSAPELGEGEGEAPHGAESSSDEREKHETKT